MEALATKITEYLGGSVEGYDTEGNEYSTLMEMWSREGLAAAKLAVELGTGAPVTQPAPEAEAGVPPATRTRGAVNPSHPKPGQRQAQKWYTAAYDYWEAEKNCPATVDGVLGGFGKVTGKDVEGSLAFIESLRSKAPTLGRGRALDCGAGIGRVTRDVLLPAFDHVDLLEQSPRLIAAAPEYIGEEGSKRVTFLCQGMQDFDAPVGTYDVIWIQWCIGHLHDVDMVTFLNCARKVLKPGGLVCVKDNCSDSVAFVLDKDDSSVTRSADYLKALFRLCNYELLMEQAQDGFPKELFPVLMFAFQPSPSPSS